MPRRVRLSIGLFLSVTLSALVAAPLAVVFTASQGTAVRNTEALLKDKARLVVGQLVSRTRQYLAPAQAAPSFLAAQMVRGALDPDDPDGLEQAIRYSFVAAPQLNALTVVHADGWNVTAFRGDDGGIETSRGRWRDDPRIGQAVEEVMRNGDEAGYWGTPRFIAAAGTTLVTFVRPVMRDGRFHAAVVATITLADLSAFVKELSRDLGENSFILYGRDRVLAHKALVGGALPISPSNPLPRISDVGDPVLASMWQVDGRWEELRSGGGEAIHIRQIEVGQQEFVVLYEELDLHSTGQPWLVGGYVASADVGAEVRRLTLAAITGVTATLFAIIGAVLLARRLSRPIANLANASEAVSRLEIDGLEPLPPSRLRELDRAVQAFNGMTTALRLFARYVPRRLVERLLEVGESAIMRSQEREVTIMFTDVVGFSQLAEAMSAERCAEFLNHHFSLLTACIEAEGGVVDKFIGDAVMAVWIAIPGRSDAASNLQGAVRAARRIREVIVADNKLQASPVRLRIGIHSGAAIVGNIGTATRLNFTVVGDAVNMAQRIEGIAKILRPGDEVAIILSAAAAELLADHGGLTALGCHQLPGRGIPVDLFAVDDR